MNPQSRDWILAGVAIYFISMAATASAGTPAQKESGAGPVYNCDFSSYKKWNEFLEIEKAPVSLFRFKRPKSAGRSKPVVEAELWRNGKITAGNCKGAEILLGRVVTEDCPDKGGPETLYVFGSDFDSKKRPSDGLWPSAGRAGSDNCHWTFRAIKVGGVIFSNHSESKNLNEILAPDLKLKVVHDERANYEANAFGMSKDLRTEAGTPFKAVAKNSYWVSLENELESKNIRVLGQDTTFGTVYFRGRSAIVKRPDRIVEAVDVGLEKSLPQYWYVDFASEMRKIHVLEEKELKPSSVGDGWYEAKVSDSPRMREMYTQYKARVRKVRALVDSGDAHDVYARPEAMEFEDFVKERPVLYYKDYLGRYQVHKKVLHEVPALAEPVLYLYPPSETRLRVELCSNLKLKASRPEYGEGWDVIAAPSGKIRFLKDGRAYPYLFWEGFAGHVPPTRRGWVVAQAELRLFLDQILPRHGLNSAEAEAFKAYWLARMSRAPFYEVEFLPQELVDRICPLNFSITPDSFLRVYMRVRELMQPIPITAPPPPSEFKRRGFTAVEWGGFFD